MKQRLGGLLCLALGAVLITTGLDGGGGGTVGAAVAQCSGSVGAVAPCPTGTIDITEATIVEASGFAHLSSPHLAAAPTPPAGGWVVHITSSCDDPVTGSPVSTSVTIPNGGTANSTDLYVFTDVAHGTKCTYTLAEHHVSGFTAVFDPPSPVSLPFSGGRQVGSDLKVALTNTFVEAPPSSTAPPTAIPSVITTVVTRPIVSSSGAPAVAVTGPREQVRATVWIGIALCLLGLAMLYAGTVQRRRARHGA